MESLLSVAFDNLSSKEIPRVRKGLRQIDGLLSQICLAKARSPSKRKSSALQDKSQLVLRQLHELSADPAFAEFFRIQDSFQWNIASQIISTLEALLSMISTSHTDIVILSALDVLQGVLLLHPPSRSLFNREPSMNLLLDLLDSANPPKIQSQAILVLVTALLDNPRNTRTFEEIDGLLCVTSVFKSRTSTKEVKMRTLEFLYFYLMPEVPVKMSSAPNTAVMGRNPGKEDHPPRHAHTYSQDSGGGMDIDIPSHTRAIDEKQAFLSKHLNNVSELVSDLRESSPFGAFMS
ncbi:hypothetical protein AMS68_001007 [Peltaster fructicola]|uniref:Cell division control protein 14 n=1 Tax=Peltaster fructicola TaxID=286661 RepID=A0A6H0XLW1_9PEZI|nr:hypothetical protein AMS68_001007 [Peltaster fructicola]